MDLELLILLVIFSAAAYWGYRLMRKSEWGGTDMEIPQVCPVCSEGVEVNDSGDWHCSRPGCIESMAWHEVYSKRGGGMVKEFRLDLFERFMTGCSKRGYDCVSTMTLTSESRVKVVSGVPNNIVDEILAELESPVLDGDGGG